MTEMLRRNNESLLTIEELANQAGISKELVAKLVRDDVIVPVDHEATSEGMGFHQSAVRVIERWKEEAKLAVRK